MRSVLRTIVGVVTVLLLAGVMPARAVDIEVPTREVKRRVLALYDAREERRPHRTRVHRFAEMPLNWLGYTVDYLDIGQNLPGPEALRAYAAVLTWFQTPMANAKRVAKVLTDASAEGLKYVALGEVLPAQTDPGAAVRAKLFANLGLIDEAEYITVTLHHRLETVTPRMVGFERPLDIAIPEYPHTPPLNELTTVHLAVNSSTRSGPRRSAVVVTSAKGGYAASGFTTFYEPTTERLKWTLNPFLFFRMALGDQRFPVPDTTTLSGRRIYFSHIDGDGWNNVSEIEGFKEAQVLASEVIASEAIERYPDLPVSVALISGDVAPLLGGTANAARVARRLFALPQVEVASHTHTHPFDWSFFGTYSRDAEVAKIKAAQRPLQPLLDRVTGAILSVAGRTRVKTEYDVFISGSDDLPRTYMREPFDLDREIAGSLKLIEQLAPSGKKAKLYQWSGDTTPFEGAIRATRLAGVRNINGGDSRLDAEFPSVAYVPPVGRQDGGERQIYAANSNENTYTNDWTGPYYGFFMLGQTLDNTETPRRLKPFNLYYHMYSGEKPSALASIVHFLERARQSPLVPIPASEYAAIADDFYGVAIAQNGLFSWQISERGAVQTVRFDDSEQLGVDLAASKGVLGWTRSNGAIYVTLDPAVEPAIVALMDRRAEGRAFETGASELGLGLVESRWRLSGRSPDRCQVRFTAEGFGPSEMTWRTTPGRQIVATADRDGTPLGQVRARADASGLVRVSLDVDARTPLQFSVACSE
jgi:hypothetical protein